MRARELCSFLLLLLLLGGCGSMWMSGSARSSEAFPTGQVEITTGAATFLMPVEIAATDRQRERGLTGRSGLEFGRGMLFLFDGPQPGDRGVWMRGVRMPLSIAYMDSLGAIVAIRQMEPCRRLVGFACPRYPPGVAYSSALEVSRGFFAERGIGVGDLVRLVDRKEQGE